MPGGNRLFDVWRPIARPPAALMRRDAEEQRLSAAREMCERDEHFARQLQAQELSRSRARAVARGAPDDALLFDGRAGPSPSSSSSAPPRNGVTSAGAEALPIASHHILDGRNTPATRPGSVVWERAPPSGAALEARMDTNGAIDLGSEVAQRRRLVDRLRRESEASGGLRQVGTQAAFDFGPPHRAAQPRRVVAATPAVVPSPPPPSSPVTPSVVRRHAMPPANGTRPEAGRQLPTQHLPTAVAEAPRIIVMRSGPTAVAGDGEGFRNPQEALAMAMAVAARGSATGAARAGGTSAGQARRRQQAALQFVRDLAGQQHYVIVGQPEQQEPCGVDPASLEAATVTMTYTGGPATSHFASGAELAVTAPESSSDGGRDECMICLEPFRVGEELRLLPCMHRYHRQCVDRWLERSVACPMCKHDIFGSPAY